MRYTILTALTALLAFGQTDNSARQKLIENLNATASVVRLDHEFQRPAGIRDDSNVEVYVT